MQRSRLFRRCVVGLCLLQALAACTNHSPTGRNQALLFSSDEMSQMGAESFEQFKEQETISTDSALNRYVQCITEAVTEPALLAAVDPGHDEQWQVVVFESDQANAFALPGGHIGVYTGLLKVAKTPDQLATVLAHEVAHVLADHGNEKVSRSQITSTGLGLAQVALDLAGIEYQGLIMTGLGIGAELGVNLPFGREQESEADQIGLEIMARAGFNPIASVQLWLNMAQASGGSPPELLSTHPSHDTRIDDLRTWQKQATSLFQQARAAGKQPSCRVPS